MLWNRSDLQMTCTFSVAQATKNQKLEISLWSMNAWVYHFHPRTRAKQNWKESTSIQNRMLLQPSMKSLSFPFLWIDPVIGLMFWPATRRVTSPAFGQVKITPLSRRIWACSTAKKIKVIRLSFYNLFWKAYR